jgi:hypothetical protein
MFRKKIEPTPPVWRYRPKEDITVYELALLVPIVVKCSFPGFKRPDEFENWELVKRHFEYV